MNAVRAEVFTYDFPSADRKRDGGEGAAYTHSILIQGHTQRGQLLGADVGPGTGDAQIFAFDHFTSTGRVTGYVRRSVAHETAAVYTTGDRISRAVDALNTLGAEVTRFVGPLDVTRQGSLTSNLNRNFQPDKTNAGLGMSVRYGAW